MNNVTLGNERLTYYETIGGGQGACPDADGPSAVHVAMSNTLTRPSRRSSSPAAAGERYALRLGSGGAGGTEAATASCGSCGRSSRAASSVIAERRAVAPAGRGGGEAGAPGRNLLNGEELPAKVTRRARRRRRARIETPGGGGWGASGRLAAWRSCRGDQRRAGAGLPAPVERVRAVAGGKGSRATATSTTRAPPGRALTLIAAEAIEAVPAEDGIALRRRVAPERAHARDRRERARRQALPGRRRRVRRRRAVRAVPAPRGVTQPGVVKGMVHRAGLNADILTDGEIAVGDPSSQRRVARPCASASPSRASRPSRSCSTARRRSTSSQR